MSRVDKPMLQCDRCKEVTDDINYMSKFKTLEHYHVQGKDEWDLCPKCWSLFKKVMSYVPSD